MYEIGKKKSYGSPNDVHVKPFALYSNMSEGLWLISISHVSEQKCCRLLGQ